MSGHLPRYKVNPSLNDTLGFFDTYVPYTNQSKIPVNDSIRKFCDFSIYDYITPLPKKVSLTPGPSIFTSHELSHSNNGPRPIHKESTDWITFLVIVSLLIIAWIQTNHSKRLKQIIRSVMLPYYVNQLEREGNLYNERITLGLGFIYTSSVSLLIYSFYSANATTSFSLKPYLVFFIIFLGALAFVLFKAFFIFVTGAIFKTEEYAHAYRLNALIFNHATGLLIFPILLLVYYWETSPFLYIALIVFCILLLYRFIRSITIGLSNTKFSVFYLILYLCTLEILPLLLLVKFVRQF
jgi:hypothetical protein